MENGKESSHREAPPPALDPVREAAELLDSALLLRNADWWNENVILFNALKQVFDKLHSAAAPKVEAGREGDQGLSASGRKYIRFLVDFIRDNCDAYLDENEGDDFFIPDHNCEFNSAPDKGHCEFHAKWAEFWTAFNGEPASGEPTIPDPAPVVDSVSVREALELPINKVQEIQAVMREHGLKVDDINDPWKKLVLSIYTDLVECAQAAEACLQGVKAPGPLQWTKETLEAGHAMADAIRKWNSAKSRPDVPGGWMYSMGALMEALGALSKWEKAVAAIPEPGQPPSREDQNEK